MDDEDRLGKPVPGGGAGERGAEQTRVYVPGGALAIDENRVGAEIPNGVDAGDERQSRTEDRVSGPGAQRSQAEVDGRGPAPQRERGYAQPVAEFLFERRDVGADGGHPVRGERLGDEALLEIAHMRDGEKYPFHRAPAFDRLRIRAGTPAAVTASGMEARITAPAPTIESAPMRQPGSTQAPMPTCANAPTSTAPPSVAEGEICTWLESRQSCSTIAPVLTIEVRPTTAPALMTARGRTTQPGEISLWGETTADGWISVAGVQPCSNARA